MTDTNPLKQYFRRPALYLKLPSGGKYYTQDVVDMPDNGELPIYPMTAIDEITCRTPDALYNGNAVVDVIKSCAPNVKNPWKITNIDLDPLLVAIKIATSGSKMEIETPCPNCGESSKYDVDLTRVLAGFKPGEYDKTLKLGNVEVKFKPLSFEFTNKANEAQLEIQRLSGQLDSMNDQVQRNNKMTEIILKMNNVAVHVLSHTIEYIKTPEAVVPETKHILEFLQNCDKNTYDLIRDTNKKLREGTETKPMDVKCISCSHEYQEPFIINMTDFFD